jgi:hypothetical protein
VITNPKPVLISLSPPTTTAGGPTFTLKYTGTGLVGPTELRWNNSLAGFAGAGGCDSGFPEAKTKPIPPTFFTTPGVYTISLYNPPVNGGFSNALTFTVVTASQKLFLPLVVR